MINKVAASFAASLACITMLAADVSAQTLSPGSDATATLAAGVRYRGLSGSGPGGTAEVQVFPSPYGSTSTTDGQGTWGASSPVTVTYNGSVLSTTAAGTSISRSVGSLGSLNYIQIRITKNGSSNSVALNTIALGGPTLGSVAVNSAPNTQVWKITGANLTAGFALTGTLVTTGLSGGGDSNFVQIEVGYAPPTDNQGPVTSSVTTQPVPALLNGQVTVTANLSDETTGNNNVASAQYSLNGGTWQAMSAQDGAFNSPNEDVQASFYATTLGTNSVCVKGTDALGNEGTPICQGFLVTYIFSGFFQPVDNDPAVNVAKAGQAVPAKWRLTDANDAPISDPLSFVSLQSYAVSCTDFAGNPDDTIEEVAAGSSGLQYMGDGYWQFNWKTPAGYANSCRAMVVEFNSGAVSPAARFRFRK